MSRRTPVGRLKGMGNRVAARARLAVIVLLHLGVSMVHGAAHAGAHVPLSLAADLFVIIVILAGPLVGLALTWWTRRVGAWLVAATMAASLVFGVVNHFMLDSPDHVARVAGDWQALFAATAWLLVATEALSCWLALRLALERKVVS